METPIYNRAAHESGHALAIILFGFRVHSATIKPTAGVDDGHVSWQSSGLDEATEEGQSIVAQIYLAGWVAEELVTRSVHPVYAPFTDASDEGVIRRLGLTDWEIQQARKDVKGLLWANRTELNDLAYALYERETLSGAEIHELLGIEQPAALVSASSAPAARSPAPASDSSTQNTSAPAGAQVVWYDTSGGRGRGLQWW